MTSIKKPQVFRVVVIQAGFLAVLGLLLTGYDKPVAFSALCGGLICLLPQAYFTLYAWQHTGSRSSQMVARGFYRGEVGKFVLTIVGFAIVFSRFRDVNPLALFGGYLLILMMQWILNARAIRLHEQMEKRF